MKLKYNVGDEVFLDGESFNIVFVDEKDNLLQYFIQNDKSSTWANEDNLKRY